MFFNLQILIVIFCIILGCTSKEEEPKELKFGGRLNQVLECLPAYSSYIKRYFKGILPNQELNKFWLCHTDILDLYVEYTEKTGVDPSYSSQELLSFINEILPDDVAKLDQQTLNSIFQVKKIVIGGAGNSIKKSELIALKKRVEILKSLSKKIQRHIPTLVKFYETPLAVRYDEMLQVWSHLEPEVRLFIKKVKFKDISYADLKDIFLIYFSKSKSSMQAESLSQLLKSYTELTVGLNKKITDDESIASYLHLAKIASFATVGWSSWLNGQNNNHLYQLLSEFINKIESSLKSRQQQGKGSVVKEAEWESIFKNISFFIDENKLSKKQLLNTWHFINEKFFMAQGGDFGLKEVNHIKKGLSSFRTTLFSYPLILSKKIDCHNFKAAQSELMQNVYFVKCATSSFQIDNQSKMQFQSGGRKFLNRNSYLSLNMKRFLISPLFRNYSSEGQLGELELDQLFGDIIDVISPYTTELNADIADLKNRLSIESDIFTPYSIGNNKLSRYEVASYLSMLDSSRSIYAEFKKTSTCASVESSFCLIDQLDQLRFKLLSNFSEFNFYLDGLDTKALGLYYKSVLQTVGSDTDTLMLSELFEVFVLLHYQEVFFTSFNTDGDRVLSYQEVKWSFEQNQIKLVDLLGLAFKNIKRDEALGIYSYLIANGELAGSGSGSDLSKVNDPLIYQHWLKFPQKRASSAGRFELVNVLNFINQLNRN